MQTALVGSAAAVAAVCATAVFGASLAHLTATPALYGAPFQAYFTSSGPGGLSGGSLLTELKRDRAISQITLVSGPAIAVNHVGVRAMPRPRSVAGCCCRPQRGGCQPATTR